MEQSAAGDRIFAAEAILKRRVRKVSYLRRRARLIGPVVVRARRRAAPLQSIG